MTKSLAPSPESTPAAHVAANIRALNNRQKSSEKWSADAETPLPAQLHTAYRVHWRVDLRWRSALLDYSGHIDYTSALTPESALDKFASDFPARTPVRIEAR